MLIEAIANWFADSLGLKIAEHIFCSEFPPNQNVDVSCCLRETGGLTEADTLLRTFTFQLVFRGAILAKVRKRANEFFDLIFSNDHRAIANLKIGNYQINRLIALQPPTYLGDDGADNYRFIFNISARAARLN